jgi:quinol monooxygenase YgiN
MEAMAFIVLWQFEVHPDHVAAFEAAYGPAGDWARLFAAHDGFIAVELVRDRSRSRQYLTIDRWRSRAEYQAMHASVSEEYRRLDRLCESFTSGEEKLGEFDVLD